MSADFDIFIIGGGINGCGIARDAIGRGYSVALCEMNDLASGTSSKATKLVHGGLRYLEHYEFRLVREALSEREILWAMAPHIIWPLRFVLPHHKGLRPAWLLRLGLFLYDHIGGRKKLPATNTLDLKTHAAGAPLKPIFDKGFEYSDCWVNDARLVVLNALDAEKKGAQIETRTPCIKAERKYGHWLVTTKNLETGIEKTQTARVLINASGPWVDKVLTSSIGEENAQNVRLVQGSHIIVPKIFDHDKSYIFQNADERIIFAIPYEQDFTLIGTTDHDFKGELNHFDITPEEVSYLCNAASEYFQNVIKVEDVVWSYSGVRPLYDDGASTAQEATRDYVLRQDGPENEAPLLNIFGGKITTYRRLAEAMMEKVENILGAKGPRWTKHSTLPGGAFDVDGFSGLVQEIAEKYPFLAEKTAERYIRSYGTRAGTLLNDVGSKSDLGHCFGSDLMETEVRYLIENEWARTAEDVVWRRSKLGLRMSAEEIEALDIWMIDQRKCV
ncbi:glycerol-3-phosphate dehydrogenase [Alphaproteobacteria bacterium 46_93_T64]|nr:glycerol-3-phosphate dehydrogenase [Alphaproteobacteria bacterium 46_93_T64]